MKNFNFLLLLFFVSLFACDTKEESSKFDRKPILVNLSDTLIIPSYTKVIAELEVFKTALGAFEANADAARLQELQAKWLTLALAWKQAEVFNFGPIENLLLASSIDFIPVDTTGINSILENDFKAGDLTALGSNKKGIAAMEFVLYEKSQELLSPASQAPYLQYLFLAADDISKKLQMVLFAWSHEYKDEFIAKEGNSSSDALTLVTNQMIFLAEKVKNQKLGIPMAKVDITTMRPEKVEAPYSHQSLRLLRANVVSIQKVFNGAGGVGLDDYLDALGIKDEEGMLLSDRINIQFEAVLLAVEAIDLDLYSAIASQEPSVDKLYLEMIDLSIILKNDMMSQLGLLTVFSDNDGD